MWLFTPPVRYVSAFLKILSSFLKASKFYPLRLVHEAGLLHFSVKVEISNTASLQPDYLWTCVEVAEGNLIGHDWVPNY